MGRLVRAVAVPLLCLALLAGRYGRNPTPPDLQEAWIYNMFVGLVDFVSDLSWAAEQLGLCDGRHCVRYGIEALGYVDAAMSPRLQGVNITETEFGGVTVNVYAPAVPPAPGDSAPPALGAGLVFFHGGGFLAGSSRNYDRFLGGLVQDLGLTVVSVEYRLAPDFPAPFPLQDCEAATIHFWEHAEDFGVDRNKIGVMGDSAGGNLAAALALKLKDSEHGPRLQYQILLYPILQGLTVGLPAHEQNDPWGFLWIRKWAVGGVVATYVGFWDYDRFSEVVQKGAHVSPDFRAEYRKYVDVRDLPRKYIRDNYKPPKWPETKDEHDKLLEKLGFTEREQRREIVAKFEKGLSNPLNFPLMAEDLSSLPPAYILACEYDTLRDDAILYAQRLEKSGNRVILDHQPQGWHGFLPFVKGQITVTAATRVYENIVLFIKTQTVRKS